MSLVSPFYPLAARHLKPRRARNPGTASVEFLNPPGEHLACRFRESTGCAPTSRSMREVEEEQSNQQPIKNKDKKLKNRSTRSLPALPSDARTGVRISRREPSIKNPPRFLSFCKLYIFLKFFRATQHYTTRRTRERSGEEIEIG